MDEQEIHNQIESLALQMGFSAYSSAPAQELTEDRDFFEKYLHEGMNADMEYLKRNIDKRFNPSLLLEGAKTILCFLASYKTDFEFPRGAPLIASYALGHDYHRVIKDKLHTIANLLKVHFPEMKYRAFTDSAPILERRWAQKAGLGFIGKNTMLINKNIGTKTFIGIIIADIELPYGREFIGNYCGSCRRCIEACPSGALLDEYLLDANKCISYHTIESKRLSDDNDSKPDFSGYVFGCDICINACPWTRRGDKTSIIDFYPDAIKNFETPERWLELEETAFGQIFADSPLQRAGLKKIKDNILNNGIKN